MWAINNNQRRKINIIKMVVAPQFNYISMMIAVTISDGLFKQYNYLIREFKLFKMGLTQDNECWKCNKEVGTCLHALWDCNGTFFLEGGIKKPLRVAQKTSTRIATALFAREQVSCATRPD